MSDSGTSRAWSVADTTDLAGFLDVFEAGDENVVIGGRPILHRAVANKGIDARVAISNFLLDRGADAATTSGDEGFTVLHILLAHVRHDPVPEAALLQRFLDQGADVNAVAAGNWGTCLQVLSKMFQFTDQFLDPFYDVLFARPDLDLLAVGKLGRSTYETVRRHGGLRAGLLDRMTAYLESRGIEAPT